MAGLRLRVDDAGDVFGPPGAREVGRARNVGSARRIVRVALGYQLGASEATCAMSHDDKPEAPGLSVIPPGGVRKMLELLDGHRAARETLEKGADGAMRTARPLRAATPATPRNFIAITARDCAPITRSASLKGGQEDSPSQAHAGPGEVRVHPDKAPNSSHMLPSSEHIFEPISCDTVWAPMEEGQPSSRSVSLDVVYTAPSSGVQTECGGLVGLALAPRKWESGSGCFVQCSRVPSASGMRRSNRDMDEEALSACTTPFSTYRSHSSLKGPGHKSGTSSARSAHTDPLPSSTTATNREGKAPTSFGPRSHSESSHRAAAGWSTTFTKLRCYSSAGDETVAQVCAIDTRALKVKLMRIHGAAGAFAAGSVGQPKILWRSPAPGMTNGMKNSNNFASRDAPQQAVVGSNIGSFSRATAGVSARASTPVERAVGVALWGAMKNLLNTRVTCPKEDTEQVQEQERWKSDCPGNLERLLLTKSSVYAPSSASSSTPSSSSTVTPRTSSSQASIGTTPRTVRGLPESGASPAQTQAQPTQPVPRVIQSTLLRVIQPMPDEHTQRFHPIQSALEQPDWGRQASAPETCACAIEGVSPDEHYLDSDSQTDGPRSVLQDVEIETRLSVRTAAIASPPFDLRSRNTDRFQEPTATRGLCDGAFLGTTAAAGIHRMGSGAADAKHGALVSGVKSGGVASKLCAMASKPARDELTEFVPRYDLSSGSFINLLC